MSCCFCRVAWKEKRRETRNPFEAFSRLFEEEARQRAQTDQAERQFMFELCSAEPAKLSKQQQHHHRFTCTRRRRLKVEVGRSKVLSALFFSLLFWTIHRERDEDGATSSQVGRNNSRRLSQALAQAQAQAQAQTTAKLAVQPLGRPIYASC